MSRLPRSTTPTRQADALLPNENSDYDSLPPINNARPSSKNFEASPIRVIESSPAAQQHSTEKLNNNNTQLNKRNGHQLSNYFYAPDSVAKPSENRSQMLMKRFGEKPNFYNGWDQVVRSQAESMQRALMEQKIEERLRKQRYKYIYMVSNSQNYLI